MRVLKDYPSPVHVTFVDVDENPVDADGGVSFTSIYSDGTPGPGGTAERIALGRYRATLTIPRYERLVVIWSAVLNGTPAVLTTEETVVGSRIFTLPELRGYDSALAGKTVQRLRDARDYVEALFERETGRAFVPTFTWEQHSGDGSRELWLGHPEILTVEHLVHNGTVVAIPDVGIDPDRGLRVLINRQEPWIGSVEIGYVYGRSTVPVDVREAALKLARDLVMGRNSRLDDRAYVLTTELGTVTLATPGQRGSRTGIPDVDVVLDAYDIRPEGFR